MAFTNNVMIVRHKLLENLVALWKENQLVEKIDRIPLEISPRRSQPVGRCCIHKERAVTKYKLLPLLGWDMTDETDELAPLSEYARKALERKERIKEKARASIREQLKKAQEEMERREDMRRSMFFLCTGELRSK